MHTMVGRGGGLLSDTTNVPHQTLRFLQPCRHFFRGPDVIVSVCLSPLIDYVQMISATVHQMNGLSLTQYSRLKTTPITNNCFGHRSHSLFFNIDHRSSDHGPYYIAMLMILELPSSYQDRDKCPRIHRDVAVTLATKPDN